MNTRNAGHYTGWAGVYAVAAELSRRGYDAALTVGNTPSTDLLCGAPTMGAAFRMEVKSLATPNVVLIRKSVLEEEPRPDLYFAIALVPKELDSHPSFFIMTHEEVTQAWKSMPKVKRDGQPMKVGFEGLNWGLVKPHADAWSKLPSVRGAQPRTGLSGLDSPLDESA